MDLTSIFVILTFMFAFQLVAILGGIAFMIFKYKSETVETADRAELLAFAKAIHSFLAADYQDKVALRQMLQQNPYGDNLDDFGWGRDTEADPVADFFSKVRDEEVEEVEEDDVSDAQNKKKSEASGDAKKNEESPKKKSGRKKKVLH